MPRRNPEEKTKGECPRRNPEEKTKGECLRRNPEEKTKGECLRERSAFYSEKWRLGAVPLPRIIGSQSSPVTI